MFMKYKILLRELNTEYNKNKIAKYRWKKWAYTIYNALFDIITFGSYFFFFGFSNPRFNFVDQRTSWISLLYEYQRLQVKWISWLLIM